MRAILIDPANKTVTEIEYNGDWETIAPLIDCSTFACPIVFENEDTMYCDDEGLFVEQEGGIMMPDWSYLILGSDEEGDTVDAKSTIAEIQVPITWIDKETAEAYRAKFN
jgi:hypothetical protein